MQEQELKAYQGVKKQGAFLLSSPRFGLGVVSTKLPNFTVIIPIRIPVTTSEYINRHKFVPTYYKEPNIRREQVEYCIRNLICADSSEIIIFRGRK